MAMPLKLLFQKSTGIYLLYFQNTTQMPLISWIYVRLSWKYLFVTGLGWQNCQYSVYMYNIATCTCGLECILVIFIIIIRYQVLMHVFSVVLSMLLGQSVMIHIDVELSQSLIINLVLWSISINRICTSSWLCVCVYHVYDMNKEVDESPINIDLLDPGEPHTWHWLWNNNWIMDMVKQCAFCHDSLWHGI